jgi:AcrR family transcriptional regulator
MSTRSRALPRHKRIRRKPEDAEREILDAAEAFLQTGDFRDLAVDEVMARTGMVRSAFYNYFPDRNALVMRMIKRIEAEFMDVARPWLDQEGDPYETLRDGLDGVTEIYAHHGHVLRAVHEASYHDNEVERYYRQGLIENSIQVVAKRLRAENRAGRSSIANPREVAHALLMMTTNVLVERLGRSPADRPRAVAKTLRFVWEQVVYGRPRSE